MQHHSNEEAEIIHIIGDIATGLSLLGLFWIVLIFFRTQAGWSFSGKIVLCLTFSYFLFTISNLMTIFNHNTAVCEVEGFLRTFSLLSAFYWAWKISRTAYYTMTDEYFRPDPETSWIYLSRGFIVPLIIAIIPVLSFGQVWYGLISAQCDIVSQTQQEAIIWDACLITAPTAVGLIVLIYFYVKINKASKDLEDAFQVYTQRFLVYPIGLSFIWFPSIVFRIVCYFVGYVFWLDVLRVALGYSLGFVHALACAIQGLATAKENKERSYSTEMTMGPGIGQGLNNSDVRSPGHQDKTFASFVL